MKYKVWIKQAVIDFIFQDGNKWLPKETGGVLLGYRANDLEFVINDVVGPGEKAVHRSHSFHPDQKFHEQEIARKYIHSGQRLTYLGDWHTHPYAYPYLSNPDKTTIKTIATHKDARLINPIMLIAAPPKTDYKIWVYQRCPSGNANVYYKTEVRCF